MYSRYSILPEIEYFRKYEGTVRPRTKPSGTFGNSKIDGLNFARLEEKMIRTGKKKVPSGKKSLSSVRNFLARMARMDADFFFTRRSEFILPVYFGSRDVFFAPFSKARVCAVMASPEDHGSQRHSEKSCSTHRRTS